MPEGVEVEMEKLKKAIEKALPAGAALRGTTVIPIAFGLKALEAVVVVKDEAGASDRVEETLSAVSGVASVEVLEMGLL